MQVAPQPDVDMPRGPRDPARAEPEVIELSDSEDEVYMEARDDADYVEIPAPLRLPERNDPENVDDQMLPLPLRPQPMPNLIDLEEDAGPVHNPAHWHGAQAEQWGGYIHDDLDVNDPELNRLMMEEFANAERPARAANPPIDLAGPQEAAAPPETQDECFANVVAIFPGICMDHVAKLYNTVAQASERLIAHILDKGPYPKAKDIKKTLKRKRDIDEDEEAAKKYGSADRIIPLAAAGPRPFIRHLLSCEFPLTPMAFIDAAMNSSGGRLFSACRVLDEAARTHDENPSYNKLKVPRKSPHHFTEENIETQIQQVGADDPEQVDVLRELQAARRMKKKEDARRVAERQKEIEEEENTRKAEAEGTMGECGCCFCDYPLNRMIHCNSEGTMHWFCRGCALKHAETEIGNSKYELQCMSMDGCEAGFSMEQRSQFLDEKTVVALERNEQEAVLRIAGIENLASCPFCPFAAEYPSVEVDREFRCQAPDCEIISCRLCKLESHIPKTCEEHAKDNGLSIRRQIEEAMSAALIRRCNKCITPFVKEEGCNKMMCTRNGCGNIQCYVCSKSCDYAHFNDKSRGGRDGQCPLFESVEERHAKEVSSAEKEALDKVRAEHPEYSEEDLKIKVSEAVQKDDEARKLRDPRHVMAGVQARRQEFDGMFRIRPLRAYPVFVDDLVRQPVPPPAYNYDDMANRFLVPPPRPQAGPIPLPVLPLEHYPRLDFGIFNDAGGLLPPEDEFLRRHVADMDAAVARLNEVNDGADQRLRQLEAQAQLLGRVQGRAVPLDLVRPANDEAGRARQEVLNQAAERLRARTARRAAEAEERGRARGARRAAEAEERMRARAAIRVNNRDAVVPEFVDPRAILEDRLKEAQARRPHVPPARLEVLNAAQPRVRGMEQQAGNVDMNQPGGPQQQQAQGQAGPVNADRAEGARMGFHNQIPAARARRRDAEASRPIDLRARQRRELNEAFERDIGLAEFDRMMRRRAGVAAAEPARLPGLRGHQGVAPQPARHEPIIDLDDDDDDE